MFIVGKRDTQQYIMHTGLSSMNIKPIMLQNIATSYGGVPTDYDAYWADNGSDIANRIMNLDEFTLEWEQNTYYDGRECWLLSGVWVTPNNPYPLGIGSGVSPDYLWDITGIDFSIEDNKEVLYFYSNKNVVNSDGIDEVIVNVEVKNSDLSLNTNFSGTIQVPIAIPAGRANMNFNIIAGKSSRVIKTSNPGQWNIPTSTRIGSYKVSSSGFVQIESLYN